MDAIPVFSQTKSLVQFTFGQSEAAKETQENFSRQCPVISQARSFGEWIKGDSDAARHTQRECGCFLLSVVNGLPIIGHVKGGIHYAVGDAAGGEMAMKAASHTTAVVAGGAAGFLAAGPVGACAVGAASGAAMDATITAVDSGISNKFRPYGLLEPIDDPRNAGKWCDALGGVALDALVARGVGNIVEGIKVGGGTGIIDGGTQGGSAADVPKIVGSTGAVAISGAFINKTWPWILRIQSGIMFLLKDGRVKQIIKGHIVQLMESYNKKSSNKSFQAGNAQAQKHHTNKNASQIQAKGNEPQKVVEKNQVQANRLDNSVPKDRDRHIKMKKNKNGVLYIFQNDKLIMVVEKDTIYEVTDDKSLVTVQENILYSLEPSGKLKKIQDKKVEAYLNKEIDNQLKRLLAGKSSAVEDTSQSSLGAKHPANSGEGPATKRSNGQCHANRRRSSKPITVAAADKTSCDNDAVSSTTTNLIELDFEDEPSLTPRHFSDSYIASLDLLEFDELSIGGDGVGGATYSDDLLSFNGDYDYSEEFPQKSNKKHKMVQ